MFFQLIVMSGNVRYFLTDNFQLFNMFLTIVISLVYNRFHINPRIFIIIGVFVLISIPPSILYGIDIRLYFGWAIRIVNAYFFVRIYREQLWEYLLSVVQTLALISLPFYFIQITYPSFFDIFNPISNFLLNDSQRGHQYLIVFLLNKYDRAPGTRNSGFMWEPSAFAAVLVWTLLVRLIKDNFKFTPWTYVLLIAFITTFSTGGYIGLIILLSASILHIKTNKVKYFGLIALLLFLYVWDLRTGIVSENFQTSVLKIEDEPIHIYNATTGKANKGEISRVAGYVLGFQSILHSPIGYGFPKNESEFGLLGYSPNAFMNLFIRWGIIGITFIIISMIMSVKFLLFHYNIKVSRIVQYLCILALIMSFNGTTLDKQIIAISILLYYWMLRPKIYKENTNSIQYPQIIITND